MDADERKQWLAQMAADNKERFKKALKAKPKGPSKWTKLFQLALEDSPIERLH